MIAVAHPDDVARIWRGLTPSMRVTLLGEAGRSVGGTEARQIAAGVRRPNTSRREDASGTARRALGRRGPLEIGQTVPAPESGPGWHTPRSITELGRAVAEYGHSLLRSETP
jgi:hypothetical protein